MPQYVPSILPDTMTISRFDYRSLVSEPCLQLGDKGSNRASPRPALHGLSSLLTGQEVAVLVNGWLDDGSYQVLFDATNLHHLRIDLRLLQLRR